MNPVLNLTQHKATPDQIAVGVFDAPDDLREIIADLLTFDQPPTHAQMRVRARELARIVSMFQVDKVMVGGAPFFMGPLVAELRYIHRASLFAFSRRESVDQPQPDGTVRKVAVFKHAGFVPALEGDE